LLKHTKYLFRFPRYFNNGLKVAFLFHKVIPNLIWNLTLFKNDEMMNQVQHDDYFLPLIFKKSSVGKYKNCKKTLDKKFFFFGIMPLARDSSVRRI